MSRALVFAGQGAQFAGMGKDLADSSSECADLFRKADATLGFELSRLCFEGPAEELQRSDNCQPAIFVTSMACLCALREQAGDISFSGAAGLSLGEWTALHAAGVLSFEDTLRILRARGRFMQEACDSTDGGMVSIIGLDYEKIREITEDAGVEIANLNSTGQTVLSGQREAVARAEELAKSAGAKKTVALNVAGAYHSSLMQSARDKLAGVLEEIEFGTPKVTVLSNVTGAPHGDPGNIRRKMLEQVTSSVHWYESIEWFTSNGVAEFVELGPGRVLSGLIRRIDRSVSVVNVQDKASLEKTAKAIGGNT
jgi:[acyl-carrier-protein] S-malonyltransferase